MSGGEAKADVAEHLTSRILRYLKDDAAQELSRASRPVGDIIESLGLVTPSNSNESASNDGKRRQVARSSSQLKSDIQDNVDRWDGRARRLSLLADAIRTRASRLSNRSGGQLGEVETLERQLSSAEDALALATEDEAALSALVQADQAARDATALLDRARKSGADNLEEAILAANSMVCLGALFTMVSVPARHPLITVVCGLADALYCFHSPDICTPNDPSGMGQVPPWCRCPFLSKHSDGTPQRAHLTGTLSCRSCCGRESARIPSRLAGDRRPGRRYFPDGKRGPL